MIKLLDLTNAFVKGRMISDNYNVAHEILHSFKRKMKNKTWAHKLDMAKAYDRLEWDFLEEGLKSLGFHHKFVSLIKECLLCPIPLS